MRILHVIAALEPGGAERMVIDLAAEAVRRGDAVAVASAGGAWLPRLQQAGVQHVTIGLDRRQSVATVRSGVALARALRRFRPDVVHTHNVRPTLAARVAMLGAVGRSRPARSSLLTTVHGLAPADYRAAARLLRMASGLTIACTPAVARSLTAAGFPASRLRTIANGAALEAASLERLERMARELGVDRGKGRRLVVGIGRLVDQKDWPVLIEAADLLDDVDVLVAGEGPLRAELQEQSARRRNPVRFVGTVDDVAALFGLARCTVSTSRWEGLPLALLESLSIGVPAVATAVDGIIDMVPQDAALLVPAGDPHAVANAVRQVLDDRALAASLSQRARAASHAWAPAAMQEAYRQTYAEVAH